MEYINITQATKQLGLSTRTLRYYEQIGLIKSERADDYAYRVYSEETLTRIRQIIVLRKLRIPLKSIAEILTNADAKKALDIFMKNISEIDTEITALSTIRDILRQLTEKLSESVHLGKKLDFLSDDIIGIADTLAVVKPKIKEEISMSELSHADETLHKKVQMRITTLPPSAVASAHFVGDDPEQKVHEMIKNFVINSKLWKTNPGLRLYGFNNPNPDENGNYGYELWVTIPEGMDVPEPLTKKYFDGGLYAGHCINFGDFDEWGYVFNWLGMDSGYTYEAREPLSGDGFIEEHLNTFSYFKDGKDIKQLDLLVPIKEKS